MMAQDKGKHMREEQRLEFLPAVGDKIDRLHVPTSTFRSKASESAQMPGFCDTYLLGQ